jgi:hypothetical protein
MEHPAVEFAHPGYTKDEAIAAALTAEDGDASFDTSQPHPADGSIVAYKKQPTLDDLQHVAKQLLPRPTSSEFADTVQQVVGNSLKPTVRKGRKVSASQAAVWAGNVRRLAREIARSGKATARAAGKRTAATGGKMTCATRAKKQVGGREDPLHDLAGMHVNQQSPTIGVEIVPKDPTNPDAFFAPAHCAVFRERVGDNEYCYVHLTAAPDLTKLTLIGFTTADGIESKRGSIFKQLQHISVVNTGLVTLLCPPRRAKEFRYGDLVYIDNTTSVPLRRKPTVQVATFTYESKTAKKKNALVGRFIETCGPHGGIRVKLDIR